MRLQRTVILVAAVCAIAACRGGGQIHNLPLTWLGVEQVPTATGEVSDALAAVPLALGVRDVRPDPSAVGLYEDSGYVVRTRDNVAAYCSTRMGEMLDRAGARLDDAPVAVLDVDLLEYRVIEGGTFNGLVRIRAFVRRGGVELWARTYVGQSKRWGRTHNPVNFNEALSNALADVTSQLLQDSDFARALVTPPIERLPPPPPPPLAPPPPPGS